MNNVLFYSFKIENIDFQSIDNLSISTPFDKADAVSNCRKELGKLGYKMAADNSHKIIKGILKVVVTASTKCNYILRILFLCPISLYTSS